MTKKPETKEKKPKSKKSWSFSWNRLSMQEQSMFAKRLSLLIKAGISIHESVTMIAQDTESRSKKAMFTAMTKDIAQGQFLSKAMSKFRKSFGEFAINIIYVGETTGTLADNLRYLATEIEKKRRLRSKVVGALVYPAVIMVAALTVCGLMTAYLFPKLEPIFRSLNVTLPLTTRGLLWLSDFLINYWLFIVFGFIALIVGFVFLLRIKPFRRVVNMLTLRMPLVGNLLRNYYIVNMCRTMSILIKSQVRITEAIEITANTCPNLVYKEAIEKLGGDIVRGSNISKSLEKNHRLFPRMLTQMIAVGERTGNLTDTLMYLGEIYEEELDETTKRLSSTIEPLTMIIMGLLVGFIAVSIITPIYEVTQHLNPR